jgi:taurine dioxygenase
MHQAVLSPVGVVVTGLPAGDVDAAAAADLRRLLADHGVVVLPGQELDDAAFLAFLRQFGDLAAYAGAGSVRP